MSTVRSSIVSVGVSFVDAPAEIAARLSLAPERVTDVRAALRRVRPDLESVLVVLRDRIELLVTGIGDLDPQAAIELLHTALDVGPTGDPATPAPCLHAAAVPTVFTGLEAVRHVLRLACGLEPGHDSNADVVDHLHHAWRASHEAGASGHALRRVIQIAVEEGERTRLRRRLAVALDRTGLAADAAEEQIDRALARFCAALPEHRISVSGHHPVSYTTTNHHHLDELVSSTFLRGADRRARPDR